MEARDARGLIIVTGSCNEGSNEVGDIEKIRLSVFGIVDSRRTVSGPTNKTFDEEGTIGT